MLQETHRSASSASRTAANDLVALFRSLRRRARQVPSGELPPSQASVLLLIEKEGTSTTTRLAVGEGVRSQSMTATLNALAERGLIERRPDPQDGRRQNISLTAAGREQVRDDRQGRSEWLAQALEERLTEQQLEVINEAIALLAEVVEE